ncbi:MAG: hypothetical protein H6969_12230 [Gammaproteobacteria bacterium]|nr:hypothetical protein [Gammaproteobacteria bacterium]
MLKLADAQRKIGLLAGDSKEDNAEATYRQILIFDPENAQALAGLEAIADEYARRARRQLSANALPESLQRIELGLAASSQHRELLRLRQNVEGQMTAIRLQKAQEEERRRSQLQAEQFLEQARSSFQEGLLELSLVHIEQGLLAVPEQPDLLALREQVRARLAEQQRQAEAERRQREEEARRQAAEAERYQAAEAERQQAEAEQRQREEEARRQAAEAGRQKTEQARQQVEVAKRGQEADQYLARAVELRRQGDQAASMQTIEKGLALVPDHKELKRLRQEVSAEIAAQQRQRAEREQREREIASLLEQADMHVKAWRLTTPTGNNAQETYQQVLKLDASNAQARAGLERIAEGYLQLAQKRRAAGALQDSLTFIEKGLEVISNHADLLRLREEVRVEESAVQQRQEQQRREQQRLEQRRQEQQQQEQERQEQQRQLEQQQRQEQRRLDRQRRWEQQQEGQRLLEQRRLEQQRQEQLRKLEQQRKEPPRQEPPRKEPPPEPKSQPPSESARPRVFGTF